MRRDKKKKEKKKTRHKKTSDNTCISSLGVVDRKSLIVFQAINAEVSLLSLQWNSVSGFAAKVCVVHTKDSLAVDFKCYDLSLLAFGRK